MAKLSELLKTIDETAKSGDRKKALGMLDNLLKKVPPDKTDSLMRYRERLSAELEIDGRIRALEEKYGV